MGRGGRYSVVHGILFRLVYGATVMIDLIEGKKVDDPVFTGLDECTRATVETCIQK